MNNVFAVVVAPASFAQPGIAASISEVQQQSLGSENRAPTNIHHASCRGYMEASGSDAPKQEEHSANLHQNASFDCHGGIISPRRRSRRKNSPKEKQSCNFFMLRELLFDINYMDLSYGCLGTRVHDTPQPVTARASEGVGARSKFQQPVDFEASPPIHLSTYMPSPKRERPGKTAVPSTTTPHFDTVSHNKHPASPTSLLTDDDLAFVDSLYSSPFICSYDTCCSFERVYDTLVQWCDDARCCGKSSYVHVK